MHVMKPRPTVLAAVSGVETGKNRANAFATAGLRFARPRPLAYNGASGSAHAAPPALPAQWLFEAQKMRTERPNEMMKLGAFFHPTGNHVAAWMSQDAEIDAGVNFKHYVRLAQTAERAKFDLLFVADAVAIRDGRLEALSRWPQYMCFFDPV